MSAFLEVLTALLALWFGWWIFRRLLRPKTPADPADDPFSLVPAPHRMGPKGKSGAVAIKEPEEDNPADAFPPREL